MNGWLIPGRRNTAIDAREEAIAELETHGQAIIATKGHRGVRERPEPGAQGFAPSQRTLVVQKVRLKHLCTPELKGPVP